jgi:hypothetical protein
MKIVTMTTGFDQQRGTMLFGLGDDNKVYLWDAGIGGWRPNWFEQPANVKQAARNAVAKGVKASGKKTARKK